MVRTLERISNPSATISCKISSWSGILLPQLTTLLLLELLDDELDDNDDDDELDDELLLGLLDDQDHNTQQFGPVATQDSRVEPKTVFFRWRPKHGVGARPSSKKLARGGFKFLT
jgi:hypothetical protein